jgi:hypothetical protein
MLAPAGIMLKLHLGVINTVSCDISQLTAAPGIGGEIFQQLYGPIFTSGGLFGPDKVLKKCLLRPLNSNNLRIFQVFSVFPVFFD